MYSTLVYVSVVKVPQVRKIREFLLQKVIFQRSDYVAMR